LKRKTAHLANNAEKIEQKAHPNPSQREGRKASEGGLGESSSKVNSREILTHKVVKPSSLWEELEVGHPI